MNEKRLYVDLHVVQTVPPSCINRDDTGSPKTAVYGGTTRARVSSQAWKKAMREYFSQLFHEQNIGSRTKKVIEMVAKEIRLQAPDEADAEKKAAEALKNAGIKINDKKGESDALRLLWNQYEGDLEDEEAEENENEDIPETEGAGADGITKLDADEIQDTNERQDADERQDTDLDLEDREYITEGTGSYTDEKGEPCEVRIRLKLEPVEEKAYVDTWTKISGFSMHLEGEVPLQDTP